jgi:hypothetical protein
MSSSTPKWFSQVANFEEPLRCPRCGSRYVAGPLFDQDPRICHTCNATLIEWFMISVVYLIDIEQAPDIVKALVNYLQSLRTSEAFDQLLSLLMFFNVEDIVSLYSSEY